MEEAVDALIESSPSTCQPILRTRQAIPADARTTLAVYAAGDHVQAGHSSHRPRSSARKEDVLRTELVPHPHRGLGPSPIRFPEGGVAFAPRARERSLQQL